MSHIATISLEIHDVSALESACKRVGLEFRRDQKTYRWWGKSERDGSVPEGFNQDDLGRCEHAIGVPNDTTLHKCFSGVVGREVPGAYEIGIIRRRDGKPGYVMHADFFCGGYGLEAIAGENCRKLKQAYATEVAKRQAIKNGFRVSERKLPNGSTQLVLNR